MWCAVNRFHSNWRNKHSGFRFPCLFLRLRPVSVINAETGFLVYFVLHNFKLMPTAKTLRTCKAGHQYYKSSNCPVCPECEKQQVKSDFMADLSAPAIRALIGSDLTSPEAIAHFGEKNLAKLHGIGPSVIKKLKIKLSQLGLTLAWTDLWQISVKLLV